MCRIRDTDGLRIVNCELRIDHLYRTIVIDPPWQQKMAGCWKRRRAMTATRLPYPTMTFAQIAALPIPQLAAVGCHVWLWTTNQTLYSAFKLIEAWDLTYLAPIHWIKPSGCGTWFEHRSQTLLFAYNQKCIFPLARFRPNILYANPQRHSTKPACSYELIEAISPTPRLELFARRKREGWDVWGNEVECDIELTIP